MGKIVWAPSALRDIDSIAEYISRDSVYQASLFVNRLFNATERLKRFPLSGCAIPGIGDPTCREIIYGSYRIMLSSQK